MLGSRLSARFFKITFKHYHMLEPVILGKLPHLAWQYWLNWLPTPLKSPKKRLRSISLHFGKYDFFHVGAIFNLLK